MKNKYEIRGDITAIFLFSLGSQYEMIIDTEDFPKINKFNSTWHIKDVDSKYGQCFKREKGKGRTIKAHRLITEAPKGQHVDHINHNTLDNRKCNLRLVSIAENQQNRLGAQSNSKSGIRGVVWNIQAGKWVARLTINKKRIHLGYFNNIIIAEKAVKEARKKLMPYSEMDQVIS